MSEDNRTQPEFSTGERIARLEALLESRAEIEEALQGQLDRRLSEAARLHTVELDGMRREIDAKATAQKDAVEKAEKATGAAFATFIEQNDRKAEVTQQRLAALERGDSANKGVGEWWGRVAVLIGSFAALAVLVFYLVHG